MSQLMLSLLEFNKNKRLSTVRDLNLYILDYDVSLKKAMKKQLAAIFIPSVSFYFNEDEFYDHELKERNYLYFLFI